MSGNFQLAIHMFLQLSVIMVVCRVMGRLLRPLGQTQVVSEMVAGVLLGPSFLGLFAPGVQSFLFPAKMTITVGNATAVIGHPSMTILYALSQIGLVLYMFLVGLDLNHKLLTSHSRDALFISLSGIITPVIVGATLGIVLVRNPDLFSHSIAPWQAALFLASAMSITAFPMLARILYEARLTQTKIGTLTLGAAAFDDASAWCLLACVIATVKGTPAVALLAIGGVVAYVLFMIFVGRPCFTWFDRLTTRDGGLRVDTLALVLLVIMVCAWLTDAIGIYSVFGAFICGAMMPRGAFVRDAQRSLESVTVSVLLPVFFVYSGLNTRVSLLVEPSLLLIMVGVIFAAFLCKGGGCGLASKFVGATWREAAAVGVLMNARGMMELILVNIAREQGLIKPALFTILVLMAIITTLAASPLYNMIYSPAARRELEASAVVEGA